MIVTGILCIPSHFILCRPSKTKIQYLELTILIDSNVRWLEVPVDDSCRVDILHTPHNLIDQELYMVIRQLLGLDDIVQVGPHQVGHHVPVDKVLDLMLDEGKVLLTDR